MIRATVAFAGTTHVHRLLMTLIAVPLLSACEKAAPIEIAAPVTTQPDVSGTSAPATAPSSARTTPDPNVSAVNDSIDKVLGDHAPYEAAITKFQKAVADHDTGSVAALIAYPFNATIDGGNTAISDAAQFVRLYDKIVTPDIAAAIARTRYEDLMVSQRGIMFGAGEAWISGVCADAQCSSFVPKVIAIQPTAAPAR